MDRIEPLISIIIPVYNRVKLLPEVLDSIKKQTYKNLEVIIVDDGSVENVEVASRDLPVHLFRQENQGAPAARNKGFEMSKGEYVIFWDADIVAEPDLLEKMLAVLQRNPEASYAYSDHISHITYHILKKIPAQKFSLNELRKNNYIHSTSLIRHKDFAVKWDENLKRFQDWNLWLSLAERGKIGIYIPEVLFTIKGNGTMSHWLPKFAYKKPWKYLPGIKKRVEDYEKAKEVILKKHKIE